MSPPRFKVTPGRVVLLSVCIAAGSIWACSTASAPPPPLMGTGGDSSTGSSSGVTSSSSSGSGSSSGGSDSGPPPNCKAVSGACGSLANCGAQVVIVQKPTNVMPDMQTGGTVEPGTYVLTSIVQYTGPGGGSLLDAGWYQETMVLSALLADAGVLDAAPEAASTSDDGSTEAGDDGATTPDAAILVEAGSDAAVIVNQTFDWLDVKATNAQSSSVSTGLYTFTTPNLFVPQLVCSTATSTGQGFYTSMAGNLTVYVTDASGGTLSLTYTKQ